MQKPCHMYLEPQPMHLDIICSLAGVIKEICQFCEFCANKKYGGNGAKVDPSAHPQHMNGIKHLLYVWSGCENHIMWVWSLNQCTLTSFVALL